MGGMFIKTLQLSFAFLVGVSAATHLIAQSTADHISALTQSTIDSGFQIGPGDQLNVQVADLDELSNSRAFKVDPDGNIDFPLIGRVAAKGRSLLQLKAELVNKLAKYITNPQVSLNLLDTQSRPVSVIGEVNSPGLHQLSGTRSLIEVISLAGGVKTDAGSKVILTRDARWGVLPLADAKADVTGKFSTATVALDDLLSAKHPEDNIVILPEDVISIPRSEIVYVVGDVRRAGGFPLASHESMSLLQALSLAEGLGPNAAANRARILRPIPGKKDKPQEISVDVKSIFAGKSADLPLYANDILFIPNSAVKSGSRRAVEAVLQVATGVAIYGR